LGGGERFVSTARAKSDLEGRKGAGPRSVSKKKPKAYSQRKEQMRTLTLRWVKGGSTFFWEERKRNAGEEPRLPAYALWSKKKRPPQIAENGKERGLTGFGPRKKGRCTQGEGTLHFRVSQNRKKRREEALAPRGRPESRRGGKEVLYTLNHAKQEKGLLVHVTGRGGRIPLASKGGGEGVPLAGKGKGRSPRGKGHLSLLEQGGKGRCRRKKKKKAAAVWREGSPMQKGQGANISARAKKNERKITGTLAAKKNASSSAREEGTPPPWRESPPKGKKKGRHGR